MPLDRLTSVLNRAVADLESKGVSRAHEHVIRAVVPPTEDRGPRFLLVGHGERQFLRMNSNSYLGMAFEPSVVEAMAEGAKDLGVGPGAVRFISGTYEPHVDLEYRLAAFHNRDSAMIFSSAYAAMIGVLVPLVTDSTVIISDELNHNCIINATRLARPMNKIIYKHLHMEGLEAGLRDSIGRAKRVVVATDGVFSMLGDHAPLDRIMELVRCYDHKFEQNIIVLADDSHGVGAFGATGRGTEEHIGCGPVDLLVGTLGKAFGVNGGYVTASGAMIRFLRETAPMYIFSNPITPAEALAASRAVSILDSPGGGKRLQRLRRLTRRLEEGLVSLGFEIVHSPHPVVPLMVRDTELTREIQRHLFGHHILATGISYPIVPHGDELIRFQVNADHTEGDIDLLLEALGTCPAARTIRNQAG